MPCGQGSRSPCPRPHCSPAASAAPPPSPPHLRPLPQPEPAGPAHLALQVLLHGSGGRPLSSPHEKLQTNLILSHQGPGRVGVRPANGDGAMGGPRPSPGGRSTWPSGRTSGSDSGPWSTPRGAGAQVATPARPLESQGAKGSSRSAGSRVDGRKDGRPEPQAPRTRARREDRGHGEPQRPQESLSQKARPADNCRPVCPAHTAAREESHLSLSLDTQVSQVNAITCEE